MVKHFQTEIRRNRISNLVADEPSRYDLDHPKPIAIALDIDYKTVQNDITFIKEKQNQIIKQFNLYALAISYHKKHERMGVLQEKIAKEIEESEGKHMLEAVRLEIDIMHNMYQLESNGINPIAEEIEEKEAEVEEKEVEEKEDA